MVRTPQKLHTWGQEGCGVVAGGFGGVHRPLPGGIMTGRDHPFSLGSG